jgi:hypothetical protein
MVKKSLIGVILLVAVFLGGFVPQYVKATRLERELRVAKQEGDLAQLRDLAGLAYVQASQKNYGLAAETSTRYFNRIREVQALKDVLAARDKITGELAKGDPAVLNDLQELFTKTRQATSAE